MKRRTLFKYLGIATLSGFINQNEAIANIRKKNPENLNAIPILSLIKNLNLSKNEELNIYIGGKGTDSFIKENQIIYYTSSFSTDNIQPLKINSNNIKNVHISVEAKEISIAIANSKNEVLYLSRCLELENISPEANKELKTCDSLGDLRNTTPIYNNQKIKVRAHSPHLDSGGGVFFFDKFDTQSLDNDGTIVVTASGDRWKRVIDNSIPQLEATWFGASIDLNLDSSNALQKTINEAERLVKNKKAKRVSIKLPAKINTASPIYLNPSYAFLEPSAGITEWQIDSSSELFDNKYAIYISGNVNNRGSEGDIPYVNTTVYILSHIYIHEKNNSNNINCIKHYATLNHDKGVSETVSQLGILKCRFTGFNDIYSNGDNGWGICFWECGFDSYKRAVVLYSGINNSERISFRECVFQNGKLAFDIDGWTGGLLIDNCSLNYNSSGEIRNKGGHIIVRGGHIENKKRTRPVCINSDTPNSIGKAKFQDVTFVNFGIDGNEIYLFTSTRKHNLILEDNRFSWAENEVKGLVATRNAKITNSTGCIFVRNWHMSGIEGRAPFVSEGLIQTPLPKFLTTKTTGKIKIEKNIQSDDLTIKLLAQNKKAKQCKIHTYCPITNSFQHRFLTWMIIFEKIKIKNPILISVYGLYENGEISNRLGETIAFAGDTNQLSPMNYENYINENFQSIMFEFDMSNAMEGDLLSISNLGAILYN